MRRTNISYFVYYTLELSSEDFFHGICQIQEATEQLD